MRDLVIMAKRPVIISKRMAIRTAGFAHGARANMRDKLAGAHHTAQTKQIAIGPSWQHVTVKTRTRIVAIPSDTKSVAVHRQLRLVGMLALGQK